MVRLALALLLGAITLTACNTTSGPQSSSTNPSSSNAQRPLTLPDIPRRPKGKTIPLVPPHKSNQADDLVRVALLLPFSAKSSGARAEADAMLKAAELALFQLGHDRLVLIPKDTKGTSDGARAAAQAAMADDVHIILGPLFSNNVRQVMAVTGRAGPPVIAFSNDSDLAGSGALLLGLTPENELARMVGYAASNGHFLFAALAPSTPFGAKSIDVTRRTAYAYGGDLLTWEPYADGANAVELASPVRSVSTAAIRLPDEEDPLSETERLAQARTKYSALVLPEGGARLLTLAPLLPRFRIDPNAVQLLGTSLWKDERLLNEPVLDGAWFVAPDPAARQAFQDSYADAYGGEPRRLSSLAYDALALASSLSQTRGTAGITRENLSNPLGFFGADGLFRFGENGLAERALAVFEIRNRRFRVIDPAPQVFPPEGFMAPTTGPQGDPNTPLGAQPAIGVSTPGSNPTTGAPTDPNAPYDPFAD